MTNLKVKSGLYVLTDPKLTPDSMLVDNVHAAIKGGAKLVQYRNKSDNYTQKLQQASRLRKLCTREKIPLIINDDVKLAKKIKASGVHLGRKDTDIKTARETLGLKAIIGVSCYNSLNLAVNAKILGADYVAFGAFFPSRTKPSANSTGIEILPRAKEILNIPVVAIGGITSDNCANLIKAGADFVAVIDAVFTGESIFTNAQDISVQLG